MQSDRTDPASGRTAPEHPAHCDVTIQLSECGRTDAVAVFDALDHVFAGCEDVAPSPRPAAGREPTVWMATFDSSTPRPAAEEPGPPPLSTPVEALLTGDHHAVAEVEKAMERLFEIRSLQSVSGEHEKESRLLLAPR
ncbi:MULTISPECIES: hypothetical protein [unclassified Streptomyces]|uniref:hypothetical protein n=1 Tax=unclassified Streptomyces TaxID=2593676 RepID=UPI001D055CF6|nr:MULTISPECIES: hypothetical protein [unclassified Streptomyces]